MVEPRVPRAQVLGVLALASDHFMGQHPEWVLRSCLLALGVADRVGLSAAERDEVRTATLLRFVGCTSDAPGLAEAFGDDITFRRVAATLDLGNPRDVVPHLVRSAGRGEPLPARLLTLVRVLGSGRSMPEASFRMSCEVADHLTARLGLPEGTRHALRHSFERWDGKGFPDRLRGEQSALAARLALLATDAVGLAHDLGPDGAVEVLRGRSGTAHDPALSATVLADWPVLLDEAQEGSAWERVTAEALGFDYRGEELDDALAVLADFADLKSVHLVGHSRGVAELAAAGAAALGMDNDEVRRVRHAGLVHDLGRCTVSSAIWDHPGPLSDTQWEEVRLHAYRTERLLSRADYLCELAQLAGAHHERVDGSGYHRGARGLSPAAGLLAAADVYQALVSPRPHRPAHDDAAAELRRAQGLHPDAVEAVLQGAGHPSPRRRAAMPAGLSEREAEVLCLVARGLTTKQIGGELFISPKTAGHHVQHVYGKIGVSSRAAAALWAVQHGLV